MIKLEHNQLVLPLLPLRRLTPPHQKFYTMLSLLQDLSLPVLTIVQVALLVTYYLLAPLFDPLGDVKGPALTRYTRLKLNNGC